MLCALFYETFSYPVDQTKWSLLPIDGLIVGSTIYFIKYINEPKLNNQAFMLNVTVFVECPQKKLEKVNKSDIAICIQIE